MKILAFCDKTTGLEMIKSLPIDTDDYVFVVGKRDREAIIKWLASENLNFHLEENFHFEIYEDSYFDWLLNLWGSHIFSGLELKKVKKTLNVHPGVLPGARGSNPVIHSMLNGINPGVTIHEIEEDIDSGAIYCMNEIDSSNLITGVEIYEKVVECAVTLFCKKWPDIKAGVCTPNKATLPSGKLQTKSETETLRTKNFQDLSSEEKSIIKWILTFQYNKNYTARIKYNGRMVNLEAVIED